MVIDDNEEQPEKTRDPIEVALLGMVIDDNKEQLEKAPSFIEVTLFGMVTDDNEEQLEYLQLVVYQKILIKTVEK